MLKRENFSEEHIRSLQQASHRDPVLLERAVYAFGLLEAISRVGLPFIFKGGTCLMLLLEHPMRLSTDIDIIVRPGTDIEEYIQKSAAIFPFVSCEEQRRIGKNNIEKRHFKFHYESPTYHREIYILLDVLFEEPKYARLLQKPIRNELLLTEGELLTVSVPDAACMLGDKLTAFAPHTTGIPLNANKDMEIMKQFYDVATLFDVTEDFEAARTTYFRLAPDEIAYRGLAIQPADALMDSFWAACSVASRGKVCPEDYRAYLRGMQSLRNHIYYENFSAETASLQAPKVMYLAACMLKGVPVEKSLSAADYLNKVFLDSKLSALKGLKKISPVSYAYAIRAEEILGE